MSKKINDEAVQQMNQEVMMYSASEMENIFKYTPFEQAIMLVGIHGIGKSEWIKSHFEKQGYAIITLFLGQLCDAGDVCGLPDRTVVTFKYGGQEISQKITEFCPPKWWPRSDDTKLVIFFDEFNRGKPEIYQCIQDMTLNRELNGLKLPEKTRIIAAINPLDDKYGYQVTELDPALWDRFNVYGFAPTRKEWTYWAIDNKVNKLIIAFITKHGALHLDPPANGKLGVVYPSRRSWVRLSNIVNQHSGLLGEENFATLRDMASGIIGEAANATFYQFLKEHKKGLQPGRVITKWDKEVEQTIKEMSQQDLLMFNVELAMYLEENVKQYFGEGVGSKTKEEFGYNLWQYLQTVPREILADFYDHISHAKVQSKKDWAEKVLESYHRLVDGFIDILHGTDDEDLDNKVDIDDHFKDVDLDDVK
jgi:hypothetical protein